MSSLVNDLKLAGYSLGAPPQGPITLNEVLLVTSMARELGLLLGTEETVHPIQTLDHLSDWTLEVSSLLKELRCPHAYLYEGPLENRFQPPNHRTILMQFLLGDILAARLDRFRGQRSDCVVQSSTASHLEGALKALNLKPPPATVTIPQFFKQILVTIEKMPQSARDQLLSKPLFCGGRLSDVQWNILSEVAANLEAEYALRRTMLVTRLSATLQSFSWSEKVSTKQMPERILFAISMEQFKNSSFSNISTADILAARHDLAVIAKVSSIPPETRSANPLTKVKVGKVPDRGGRPSEQAAPPPEMPSWQQRSGQAHSVNQFQDGRGGGRGGGHHNNDQHRGGSDQSSQRGSHQGGQRGRPDGQGGGYNSGYDQTGGYSQGGGYQQGRGDTGYQQGYQGPRGGGYQGGNQGSYDQSGGYQNQRGNRGGNQGGYDQSSGYQQGYQNQRGHHGGNQGGYDQGYQNQRGGYQGDSQGGYYEGQTGGYTAGYNQGGGYNQEQGRFQRGGQRGGGRGKDQQNRNRGVQGGGWKQQRQN